MKAPKPQQRANRWLEAARGFNRNPVCLNQARQPELARKPRAAPSRSYHAPSPTVSSSYFPGQPKLTVAS